ncbi:hypothetical protein GCM10022251_53140 [Phytohabitans flavus]|uniref:Uncharacterized protein n=1 Tax=Phytohabitans flavus TaxID=1076124 RepID=A0A6F8Y7R2_9ACTN|nr:hypothetical protein [Phytohabitans flavus]BCB82063.1 hypothetical protein Pflav_084730 [Phytohabitans flavus]
MSDLTTEEKATLKTAVFGAVYLVSDADPGFFAMLRESFAASGVLAGATGLVKEVLTTGPLPRLPRGSAAEVEALVLPALAQSVAILREKAPAELDNYQAAVVAAVEQAAGASHGVNAREADALTKVKTAVGVVTDPTITSE